MTSLLYLLSRGGYALICSDWPPPVNTGDFGSQSSFRPIRQKEGASFDSLKHYGSISSIYFTVYQAGAAESAHKIADREAGQRSGWTLKEQMDRFIFKHLNIPNIPLIFILWRHEGCIMFYF